MTLVYTYLAICLATLAGVWAYGAPKLIWLVPTVALVIGVVGVPHGGLDHWLGRRLLVTRFDRYWWLIFFPAYLAVALGVVWSWLTLPVPTLLLFFIASAWHFGREDDRAETGLTETRPTASVVPALITHVNATAVGGLPIWIPAIVRPEELTALLCLVQGFGTNAAAIEIVTWTARLAYILIPWAALVITIRLVRNVANLRHWVPLATTALAANAPVLLSFSIFFCAWHSVQGLIGLQRQERLSNVQFMTAILPLSVAAVLGVALGGWCLSRASVELGNNLILTLLPTLFIGLAAMAIPHLLLHELAEWADSSPTAKGARL